MLHSLALVCAIAIGEQSTLVSTLHGADEVFLWGNGLPDGRQFDYVVPTKQFAKLAAWAPEKDPPPLTIARAIEIAKGAIRADHQAYAELLTWTIELHQASARRSNVWFYVLSFYPVLEGEPQIYTTITVVALMDGTIVKPRERKPGK